MRTDVQFVSTNFLAAILKRFTGLIIYPTITLTLTLLIPTYNYHKNNIYVHAYSINLLLFSNKYV